MVLWIEYENVNHRLWPPVASLLRFVETVAKNQIKLHCFALVLCVGPGVVVPDRISAIDPFLPYSLYHLNYWQQHNTTNRCCGSLKPPDVFNGVADGFVTRTKPTLPGRDS